jgi:uncharacterized membrane protein
VVNIFCIFSFIKITALQLKKLLHLFGILDIITLIRSHEHLIPGSTAWINYPLITIASSVLYASLIFSAYFLIRKHKAGLWLTYIQFPLRLAFLVLSFGFLLMAVRSFNDQPGTYSFMLWFVTGLEIVRLIITIVIHKKYFFQGISTAGKLFN